jgi:integrase
VAYFVSFVPCGEFEIKGIELGVMADAVTVEDGKRQVDGQLSLVPRELFAGALSTGPRRIGSVLDSAPATSSLSPRIEKIISRRRFQKGRVYLRGKRWVGTYREYEGNPQTGKRARRTITFDETVTSKRSAECALKPYLDDYNEKAKAGATSAAPQKSRKTVGALVKEWTAKILPNRKPGGARAALSHIRVYILPQLGAVPLRDMNLGQHQAFVTAIGQSVNRRKTAENVHGTLGSILNLGRKWGYAIPTVEKKDIVFPADKKAQSQIYFFDADTAARVINAAEYPYKLMLLIAAVCGLRIGEVTALKISSLDFRRKLIHVTAALDYATRKEGTPKSGPSAAPVCMSDLLTKHLKDWLAKHCKENAEGYLFINSKGRTYLSDNVVRFGVHRAMSKLGIKTPKGVHVGIHCFRHGVTSELLESGTPIHVVTRLMRHADSKVTLDHYAHIVGDAERVASEKFSQRIGQNITQLESDSQLESNSSVKSA